MTGWPQWIADSYARTVGGHLSDPEELDDLPAVVLCHDTSPDPLFVYANRAARALWEAPLLGTPSRYTAPEQARAERASALAAGDVVRGYSGLRVTATGRLFVIEDATVWPVHDALHRRRGQAATFDRWRFLDPE